MRSLRGPASGGRRAVLIGLAGVTAGIAAAADPDFGSMRDGAVVLLRHADAPGIGDPPGFALGDCRTQRNLDAAGRAQARHIGAAFKAHAIDVRQVLHSQWCRTRDTAELAFPGLAHEDVAFNSFFADDTQAAAQTARARATLAAWAGPGVLVVVTHQVNITALTGIVPSSGEAVVVRVRPGPARLDVVARLRP